MANGKVLCNRELSLVLRSDLDGRDGWAGKAAQEEEDLCMLTADSCCFRDGANIIS